jgi:hypothetical protein
VLDLDKDEEEEEDIGAAMDDTDKLKGKSCVVKTTSRQVRSRGARNGPSLARPARHERGPRAASRPAGREGAGIRHAPGARGAAIVRGRAGAAVRQ